MKTMAVPERLYTPKEAPTVVGLKKKTLDEYRRLGVGPDFIRAGSRIFYKESSLLAYLDTPGPPLPIVVVNNRELRDASAEAIVSLQKANIPPILFARSGQMVHIVCDE